MLLLKLKSIKQTLQIQLWKKKKKKKDKKGVTLSQFSLLSPVFERHEDCQTHRVEIRYSNSNGDNVDSREEPSTGDERNVLFEFFGPRDGRTETE